MPTTVTLADVERAREIVSPALHRTPLFSSRSLSERIGTSAYLKAENFQRTGSFKPRGAVYAVSKLSSEQRQRGIVTMSAGNAAQAIAFAARTAGVRVTVAMPQTAPQSKVDASRPT
jgi:threonine dehydratase